MRSCGIVTEYNPFHNGHRYHIEQARRISGCDALLAVMSGNFVQRGECAIVDKWTRAKAAIQAGCDLVIELPYPYVVQRSDIFARQAVALLQLAGINTLVFGSETTDMQQLHRLADTSYEHYQKQRKNGISMAKTLEMVHGRVASNDILGMAYLRALKDSAIQPSPYSEPMVTMMRTFSMPSALRLPYAEPLRRKSRSAIQHPWQRICRKGFSWRTIILICRRCC